LITLSIAGVRVHATWENVLKAKENNSHPLPLKVGIRTDKRIYGRGIGTLHSVTEEKFNNAVQWCKDMSKDETVIDSHLTNKTNKPIVVSEDDRYRSEAYSILAKSTDGRISEEEVNKLAESLKNEKSR
jgi:hypothetical protein